MRFLFGVFAVMFSLSAFAADIENVKLNDVRAVQVETPAGLATVTEAHTTVTKEQMNQILEALPEERDLLLSTDSEDVTQMFVKKESSPARKGLSRLLPLGALAQKFKNSKAVRDIVNYKNHLVQSVKNDKIGLIIVTVNTAYDSYVWMHATEYSPEVRAAQMIFTTMNAIIFSLDKDAWAKVSGTIRNKIFKVLDITQNSLAVDIAGRFAANLALGLAVQTMRVGILAYDKVLTMPELMNLGASTLLLSLGFTFSSFAWSEFSKDVNGNTHPAAKFMVRRFAEVRSVLMGHLAPSGKLLQPETYGNAPWIALAVNGAIGLVTFLNGTKMAEWTERKFGPMIGEIYDILGAQAPAARVRCQRVLLN